MRRLVFSLMATLSILPASADILPYEAVYKGSYNGMDIEVTQTLTVEQPGSYRETMKAKNFFGMLEEESLFRLNDTGALIPCEYRNKRALMGISRDEQQQFDWQAGALSYRKGEKIRRAQIAPGTLDLITHKLQLRRDLAAGLSEFSYLVAARGKLKEYQYQISGEEMLNTPIGELRTVKVERIREDDARTTTLWLAADWNYLLVQMNQREDGDDHQMQIQRAQINGVRVQSPPAILSRTN